jgi:hypothetical protein
LTVTPASDIPRRVAKRKQKLIIGNLQRTPLYDRATMNIHSFSDTIMEGLMKRLDIPIPTWILRRRVRITCQCDNDTNKSTITIEGRDPDNINIPFTLFQSIQVTIGDRAKKELMRNHLLLKSLTKMFIQSLFDFISLVITMKYHSIFIILMSKIFLKKINSIYSTIHLQVNGEKLSMKLIYPFKIILK